MDMLRSLTGSGNAACEHLPNEIATPNGNSCEECGSTHSLRMCVTCGHVGCCESQAGDAEEHWRQSGHEVMASMPVDSGFKWCYDEKRYVS